MIKYFPVAITKIFVIQKSHDAKAAVLPLEKQISIDKHIEQLEKMLRATEKRNARIKELVDTEVS